ncbi:MAG: Gfo/Idh/MocA family oxidoreductase [Synergistaceae bacterium]|jgi:myo-inositol 2-dehydrogenase/D-chiro-inositol 1-dehydrogenase/scyllo-inositol 2-dehydrogenase (NAD+)|nr:Gfo/Idh/MocA family oxidoreductase [Synergistaceae bacterium]
MKNVIGICVIGAGRAGLIHARNFRSNVPGARLVAVTDPVESACKSACEALNIDTYYLDYRESLENPEINAVVVVAPTVFHRDIVVNAADAKRHVFCEKPMAMNEAECYDMMSAAERNGVKLQIGFMRRFDAGFRQAKEIVTSGAVGDVVMVRSNTRGPSVPQPWMYDIRKSNGPLAEVNSHDIDTLRWFTESEFSSVYAIGGNYRSPDARAEFPDFYDNVVVSAAFANGCQGIIDGAQGVGYAYDARTEILGTKGCVFVGRLQDKSVVTCTADSHAGTYSTVPSWRQLFEPAYLAEDAAFAESIANDTPPYVTGRDGLMAVRVVNAGNSSIMEKRIVNCDTAV